MNNNNSLIYIVLFLIFYTGINAQSAAGISFFEGTFHEALTTAKEQNKMVFMDAYAVWCAPCKRMDKDVFTNADVGDYFNEKFINIKIDMEKGEGVALAEKYGVQAFPTFLFLDPEGAVMHRGIGYQAVPNFLDLAEIATDPKRQLGSMNRRYFNGERDPQFLMSYAQALQDVMDPKASQVIGEYLKSVENWDSDESRELLMMATESAGNPYFDYMVENRDKFIKQFGQNRFEEKIYRANLRTMMEEDELNPTAAEYYFKNSYPEQSEKLLYRFKMGYYKSLGEFDNYAKAALERHEKFPMDNPMELNQVAWDFYEHVEDKKLLKKGLKLAQESVAIAKQYENTDTLAALYFKLGKKKKARKYANEAIQIARDMGLDPKDSMELLAKINAKK